MDLGGRDKGGDGGGEEGRIVHVPCLCRRSSKDNFLKSKNFGLFSFQLHCPYLSPNKFRRTTDCTVWRLAHRVLKERIHHAWEQLWEFSFARKCRLSVFLIAVTWSHRCGMVTSFREAKSRTGVSGVCGQGHWGPGGTGRLAGPVTCYCAVQWLWQIFFLIEEEFWMFSPWRNNKSLK